MQRHRGLLLVTVLLIAAGYLSWALNKRWEGWEYMLDILRKLQTTCHTNTKARRLVNAR